MAWLWEPCPSAWVLNKWLIQLTEQRDNVILPTGLPSGASGKEPICRCRRHKETRVLSLVGKIPWNRKQQPTPVFLPGEAHGQRSLEGYRPEGCRASTLLKWLSVQHPWMAIGKQKLTHSSPHPQCWPSQDKLMAFLLYFLTFSPSLFCKRNWHSNPDKMILGGR